jgi:hypothetical protein
MPNSRRRTAFVVAGDLLIALFAFWLTRYFGDLPRWYWLVLSSLIWVVLGCAAGKLNFDGYRRVRYAIFGIFVTNLLIGVVFLFLYRYVLPERKYGFAIFWTVGVITLLEWFFYALMRKFVYRKIPFFYEEPGTEGIDGEKKVYAGSGKREGCSDADIGKLREAVGKGAGPREVLEWISGNKDLFSHDTVMVDTADPETLLAYRIANPTMIVLLRPLNRVRHINTLFSYANYCLEEGGCLWCHFTTWAEKKKRILRSNPFPVKYIVYFFEYCWHRISPDLAIMKRIYSGLTKGKKRALCEVSVMGQLYRAGFDIERDCVAGGEMYICASKVKEPIRDDQPSTGHLIRLKRIGKDGIEIGVYKFRTMYPYSEYLQPYIYKKNSLAEGGKIADDWRVTRGGHFLRATWMDELPMLLNWFKGDLKLVGVRPLSKHYFGLYPKELQDLRIKTKPGLVPPFYADMPKTLEEIEDSEMRYLKSYFLHPFPTDWKYFWKATGNIVFKGRRSS